MKLRKYKYLADYFEKVLSEKDKILDTNIPITPYTIFEETFGHYPTYNEKSVVKREFLSTLTPEEYSLYRKAMLVKRTAIFKRNILEKYGVDNLMAVPEFKEKQKKTCLEKYGVENPFQVEEFKQKSRETNIKNLGVPYPMMSKDCRDKMKQTNLQTYGVKNVFQAESIKEKMKRTCLEKYGAENPSLCPEIVDKIFKSRKKNHSLNTSKPEKQIEQLLKEKFPEVKCQYKEERYPYPCDFYIPSEDLFIEYQGSWTHGCKPFEGTPEDLEKLNLWKTKDSDYYKRAIEVWTKRDCEKRETAKKNKLNWLEFFNMKDFMEWYLATSTKPQI